MGKEYFSVPCSTWNSENDDVICTLSNESEGYQLSADLDVETLKKNFPRVDKIEDFLFQVAPEQKIRNFLLEQTECNTNDKNLTPEEILKAKKKLIDGMTPDQLKNALSQKITFNLHKKSDGSIRISSYQVERIEGVFDSHFITRKGVVLSSSNPSTKYALNLARFLFQNLELPILKTLPAPLTVSSSDIILANEELCFVATGSGTNEGSVRALLRKGVFGTKRVAVVRDIFERDPEQHLKTYMNIISDNTILLWDSVVGAENPIRRLVSEYVEQEDHSYRCVKMDVELKEYLTQLGFDVILISPSFILNCGKNLLVGNEAILNLLAKVPVNPIVINLLSKSFPISRSFLIIREGKVNSSMKLPDIPKDIGVNCVWDTNKIKSKAQSTNKILMVAPIGFQTNAETFADNYFMKQLNLSPQQIEHKALLEFSEAHKVLTGAGVQVILHTSDRHHNTPDALFPNNWFSTHTTSELDQSVPTMVLYPMKTPSRRAERRNYIIEELQQRYGREINLTTFEYDEKPLFLEGTGALVIDRVNRIGYAVLSQRCSRKVTDIWASKLGYKMVYFKSYDDHDRAIYHTNVMMAVGSGYSVVCLESVKDANERQKLKESLESTNHEIIDITLEQVNQFCGNVLEVQNQKGQKFLVMSKRAHDGFTDQQKQTILKHVDGILRVDLDIIETIGGGGIRCMMGELF
jgi:hypothetical protein